MIVRDNFSRFLALRRDYPRFIYHSHGAYLSDNYLNISFKFIVNDSIIFQPKSRINLQKKIFRDIDLKTDQLLDQLVFNIGMIELISYWKSTCSPVVALPEGRLSKAQEAFWKKLYFNGLGEFFYVNGIQAEIGSFMTLEGLTESSKNATPVSLGGPPIVPVGGGKDSAVTLGTFKSAGLEFIPFAINPIQATRDTLNVVNKAGDETVIVERQIDPLLLKMNEEGYLNGHTPFSAVVAFYSLLAAYLTGSAEIILSNESSANEATIPGTSINHQYSKSFEFEQDFRDYTRQFISPSFNYFSFLRPLSELQIAQEFAKHPEFFPFFRSCNVGSKANKWCGKCPKCLFTWIILSPFLEQQELQVIFGKDLLSDENLTGIMDELTGISAVKPFECIGTIDEVNEALSFLKRRIPGEKLPGLLRHFNSLDISNSFTGESFYSRLNKMNPDHFVPERYLSIIKTHKDA